MELVAEPAGPERVRAGPAAAAQVSRTRSRCACPSRILTTRPRLRAPVTLEAAEPAGLARAARHVRAGPVVALAEPVERAGLVVLVVLVDRLRSNISS